MMVKIVRFLPPSWETQAEIPTTGGSLAQAQLWWTLHSEPADGGSLSRLNKMKLNNKLKCFKKSLRTKQREKQVIFPQGKVVG